VRIYINGNLENTGSQPISGNVVRSANPVRIGYTSALSYFNGCIDDVKIYRTSLDASQVSALYNSYSNSIYTLPDHEWRFDLNGYDYTGNKDATLNGGYTWVTGKQAHAIDLNGSSGYVSIPDSPALDNMDKFTISVWIKMHSLPPANKYYNLVSKEDGNTGSYRIVINSNGTGHIAMPTTNNGWYSSGTTADWTTPLQVDTWYNITATYDGSYLRIYVNGSLAGTGSQAISGNLINSPHPLRFGYAPSAIFSYFDGVIDNVRIYDGALDSGDVLNLYNLYN